MHNQRYQSVRTFSVSLLVMSLFLLGANMDSSTPYHDDDVDEVDLELTKTCDATRGMNGSIHLTVTNSDDIIAPDDATGVEVTDWIPDDITFTSSEGDGSFDLETGVWTVGDVDLGETVEIWIDFTADEQGEYSNHAEVTAQDQTDFDSSPGSGGETEDDYDSCTFVIAARGIPDFVPEKSPGGVVERGNRFEADLEATKIVTDGDGNEITSAAVGSMVHYKVSIKNLGPHSTAKVKAKDHLPDCLTETSSEVTRGTYDGWFWDIGAIKKDETVTLEVWGTVSTDCSGTVTNGVWITKSSLPDPSNAFNQFGTPSPTLLNNHAEASFEVTAANARVLDGTRFELGHSYPNPFNPTTLVPFSLAKATHVSIRVYDMLGREVSVLVNRGMAAGAHEVVFEANTLPTGIYLIRMEAAGTVQIQRVTLMK